MLDKLKNACGFIPFGAVNVEMLMGPWNTLYIRNAERDGTDFAHATTPGSLDSAPGCKKAARDSK
jgi:hypothetical protein